MDITVEECEEMVKGLGKFEGEKRYVPYFWEAMLNGMVDYYEGEEDEIYCFVVNMNDIKKFPELENKKIVRILETSNGFVMEV